MSYRSDTNSWLAFRCHAAGLLVPGSAVFEIGPGNPGRSVIGRWCLENGYEYNWADLNQRGKGVDGFHRMVGPYAVEAANGQFHAVVSFQMLHNCRRPWLLVPELARLCKPGGVVIISDSMYERENRHPVDCGRIWPDGLKVLLEDAGLGVEKLVIETGLDGGRGRKNTIGHVEAADLIGIGRKPG